MGLKPLDHGAWTVGPGCLMPVGPTRRSKAHGAWTIRGLHYSRRRGGDYTRSFAYGRTDGRTHGMSLIARQSRRLRTDGRKDAVTIQRACRQAAAAARALLRTDGRNDAVPRFCLRTEGRRRRRAAQTLVRQRRRRANASSAPRYTLYMSCTCRFNTPQGSDADSPRFSFGGEGVTHTAGRGRRLVTP